MHQLRWMCGECVRDSRCVFASVSAIVAALSSGASVAECAVCFAAVAASAFAATVALFASAAPVAVSAVCFAAVAADVSTS